MCKVKSSHLYGVVKQIRCLLEDRGHYFVGRTVAKVVISEAANRLLHFGVNSSLICVAASFYMWIVYIINFITETPVLLGFNLLH
jgi:hypothetical protein